MITYVFVFMIGLLIGWNTSQPEMVLSGIDKLKRFISRFKKSD